MAYELLTSDTCALALIDHQPQMFFGTHSHERTTILHNVQILAKSAKLFKVPTVLTTVAADSFSGQLLPEVQSVFAETKPIDRTSMNSWEDRKFRDAIKATGKKKIVIAGLWTEVCVAFPTVQMLAEASKSTRPRDDRLSGFRSRRDACEGAGVGVKMLSPVNRTVEGRTAMVEFPGGYIAEIHEPAM